MSSHLLSGMAAGVLTSALLHPLDVLKVKFQVQDGVVNRVQYRSLPSAVAGLWRSGGVRSFYRGVFPALWGSGVSWGLYFFFYESCKRRLAAGQGGEGGVAAAGQQAQLAPPPLSATQLAYAAWEGGTITCLFTNPIFLVKTRMQLQGGGEGAAAALPPYRSMAHAFACILRDEGVRGLYRGLVPALLLTSHGVVQFVTYELIKRSNSASASSSSSSSSSTAPSNGMAQLFSAGLVSKVAATVLTYPYQVTKSRLQQRFAGAPEYTSFLDVVRKILAREGVAGFYKGMLANLLRVAPQSALTLVTYEVVQQTLSTVGV